MANIRQRRIRRHMLSTTNKQNQLRKVKRNLLRIFIFFLLIWTSITFLRSDFFQLEAIEITGNNRTEEAEIITAMAVEKGQNIWQMNMAQLEERILTIPRVEKVKVSRDLPNILKVEIVEKKVLALLPYQEYYFEVGKDGRLIAMTQEVQNYELPILTGIEALSGSVGEIILSGETLQNLQEVCEAVANQELEISEINLQQPDNVIIVTMDGLVVWLGLDDYVEKVNILKQIADKIAGWQHEGYLDLTSAKAPAFHPTEPNNNKNN